MTIAERTKRLAEATKDAYSADRYRSWPEVVRKLLRIGLTEREAEAVLRSKWARWAADEYSGKYGTCPAIRLIEYVKKQGHAAVLTLTEETFAGKNK